MKETAAEYAARIRQITIDRRRLDAVAWLLFNVGCTLGAIGKALHPPVTPSMVSIRVRRYDALLRKRIDPLDHEPGAFLYSRPLPEVKP